MKILFWLFAVCCMMSADLAECATKDGPKVIEVGKTPIPPPGKLVYLGSDPEISIKYRDGLVLVTFPITLGQREKMGKSVSWTMSVSVAHYRNNEWQIKSAEKDRYEVKTESDKEGKVANIVLETPVEGCDWVRFWGKAGSEWLWISQASKYYRLSETKMPGYEMLICADGNNYPLTDDYSHRK